jgi:hypothetical protein
MITDVRPRPAPVVRAIRYWRPGGHRLIIPARPDPPGLAAFLMGGELPRAYYRTLDPFVALTAAATVTGTCCWEPE